MPQHEDQIDRLLARIVEAGEFDIDLDVEGIVDRIGKINSRMKKAQKATLREHDLTPEEWGVMCALRLGNDACRSSPGDLAGDLELSSGAMTSRLDRLEEAGIVRRLPDPDDRRGVVVELTEKGRDAWDLAANVQGRREAFFARTLTKPEQKQLNTLLRKLLRGLDDLSATPAEPVEKLTATK